MFLFIFHSNLQLNRTFGGGGLICIAAPDEYRMVGGRHVPWQKIRIQDPQDPTVNHNFMIQDPQDPMTNQNFRIQDLQDPTTNQKFRVQDPQHPMTNYNFRIQDLKDPTIKSQI